MKPTDFSEPERRLWEAYPHRGLVDLRTGERRSDDPASGSEWGSERTVRGEVITELLLGASDPGRGRAAAVRLAGARITGVIDVSEGTVSASLHLTECYFDHPIELAGATSPSIRLVSCVLPGFNGRNLSVKGSLKLDFCEFNGVLELRHAHITTSLTMTGTHLSFPGRCALSAGGMTTEGGIFCRNGFRVDGNVRLIGARLNGGLFLQGAQLHNPEGDALTGDQMTIPAVMECNEGFESVGVISLRSAHIGRVSFADATLRNPMGFALHADHLKVATTVQCNGRFRAYGEVCLNDAHVGTILDFTGARLHNPSGSALAALGLTVDAIMNCCDGFESLGAIELSHANIRSILCFERAHLSNPGGLALWAEQLHAKDVLLQTAAPINGTVDLRHAYIDVLHDDPAVWPASLRLDGLIYESLDPLLPAHDRLEWLRRDPDGSPPQPYEQLAKQYRKLGSPEDARAVLLARQRRRRHSLPPVAKAWGYLQDWTVGYGYRPLRAALWLLMLLTAGSLVFGLHHPPAVKDVDPHSFQPVIYTLDLLLPIVDFHQESSFTPRGAQAWFAFALVCAGWVLATTIATGITRTLRRD